MDNLQQIAFVVESCLKNATRLLGVARDARKPDHNHISYHLATLALEEVGKASMIAVSSLRQSSQMETEEAEGENRAQINWIDDHQRKLFWALYTPTFGKKQITADEIRELQATASHIHNTRLATLYVDPANPGAQDEISDADLEK